MGRYLLPLVIAATLAAPSARGDSPQADVTVRLTTEALDVHVGGNVTLAVHLLDRGPADAANIEWSASFSSNLNPYNAPHSGSVAALAAGRATVAYVPVAVVRPGPASIRISVHTDGDPDPSNDVATFTFRALPAVRTFVELRDPVPAPAGDRVAFVRWSEPRVRAVYPGPDTLGRIYVARPGRVAVPVTPTGGPAVLTGRAVRHGSSVATRRRAPSRSSPLRRRRRSRACGRAWSSSTRTCRATATRSLRRPATAASR